MPCTFLMLVVFLIFSIVVKTTKKMRTGLRTCIVMTVYILLMLTRIMFSYYIMLMKLYFYFISLFFSVQVLFQTEHHYDMNFSKQLLVNFCQ